MNTADEIIQKLELKVHPEGGYYKEIYRSKDCHLGNDHFPGQRPWGTSIYFLLKEGQKSHLHRLHSDEIWHFHLGGKLKIKELTPNGKLRESVLGANIMEGEHLQWTFNKNNYFCGQCVGSWVLIGCTMAPGFDFRDFQLAKFDAIVDQSPEVQKILTPYILKES